MAHLARITVYPIKSLPGQAVDSATLQAASGLANDRRFALVDAEGRLVNGKRTPAIHRLDAQFHEDLTQATLCGRRWPITTGNVELDQWFSDLLKMPVRLLENRDGGFPDDTDAPGPTVVSTATLQTIADWYPGTSLEEMRARFRPNLEIDGVEAFWEDRLFGAAGDAVRFRIGETVLDGTNPCQRCVVPSRHPQTGAIHPGFAATFARQREHTLPRWANASRFDHFYRLAVNTRPVRPGILRVGDAVELL